MEHRHEVTFVLRRLLNMMRRLADSNMNTEGFVTPMQGRVIGYLKHHPGQEVFQRDLEREFQIRRSTASAILQTMEKAGLVRREPVPQDARLKKLMLTQRAESFSERFVREMANAEAMITQGVTQEELDMFFRVVGKFEQNLNAYMAQKGEMPRCEYRGEGKHD